MQDDGGGGELPARMVQVIDAYLAGSNKRAAMRAGGYSEGTILGHGPRLVFGRQDVKDEIVRRQALAKAGAIVDQKWVLERLMAIADSGRILAKFKKVDKEGLLQWDFTGATQAELALIDSLTTETDANGVRKFKITTEHRKAALDSICRIMGYNKDSVEHKGEMTLVERLQQGRARSRQGLNGGAPNGEASRGNES